MNTAGGWKTDCRRIGLTHCFVSELYLLPGVVLMPYSVMARWTVAYGFIWLGCAVIWWKAQEETALMAVLVQQWVYISGCYHMSLDFARNHGSAGLLAMVLVVVQLTLYWARRQAGIATLICLLAVELFVTGTIIAALLVRCLHSDMDAFTARMPALWLNFPMLVTLSCSTTVMCYYLLTIGCHELMRGGHACTRSASQALSSVASWCECLVESVEGWGVVARNRNHPWQGANGHVDERPLIISALDKQLWKCGLNSRTRVLYFARGHWSSQRDSHIPLNVLVHIEAFLIETEDRMERQRWARTSVGCICCRRCAVNVPNACGGVFRCARRQRTPVIPLRPVDAPQSRAGAGAAIFHHGCNTPLADAWTSVAQDLRMHTTSKVRSRRKHEAAERKTRAGGQQFMGIVP